MKAGFSVFLCNFLSSFLSFQVLHPDIQVIGVNGLQFLHFFSIGSNKSARVTGLSAPCDNVEISLSSIFWDLRAYVMTGWRKGQNAPKREFFASLDLS